MRQDAGRHGCSGRDGWGLKRKMPKQREASLLRGCSLGDVHVSLIAS